MLNPSMPPCAPADRRGFHATAWLLILTFLCVLLFPVLLMRGMSLDGVIYATVSRNMAVGIGDVWHPAYTATIPVFYDAPPLAFLLESFFFRLFGDQWWVERLYSLITAVPTGVVIVLIWRRLLRHAGDLRVYSWLAIALWVSMPNWSWIYRHNFLENTLGIFTALAIYGSLHAMENTRWWAAWTALTALSITAAILSKGPVGLFPAVSPALIWLTMRPQSFRKSLLIQLSLVVFLVGFVGLLLTNPAARGFLSTYFNQQVVNSLQGRRDVVDSKLGQFYLLAALPRDLVLPCAVAVACVIFARSRAASQSDRGLRGPTVFCLLTAMSASLPIMISPKQTAFYAAPSWPFYTMALALWCLPAVVSLMTRLTDRVAFPRANRRLQALAGCAIGLTIAMAPFWVGRFHRDRNVIQDVDRIGQIVNRHSQVTISPELGQQWGLHAYLYRWYYISVQESGRPRYRLEYADRRGTELAGCTPVDANLKLFRLYEPAATASESTQTRLR